MSEASVFDVAKYILRKLGRISTWKLQKLCYYAQAWELAWTDNPLFEEEFEAWANGPVCRELYNEHRKKYWVTEEDIRKGNPDNLSQENKDDIDIIIRDYGSMEPWELREQTHCEDPWRIARGDISASERCSNTIPKESMAEYYAGL
ncbi:MAG: DUF4065 domain-containing protein [Clostridiales bacterium]|nr:DUF4065 domain-containing protein [Clostridiales bacterium]